MFVILGKVGSLIEEEMIELGGGVLGRVDVLQRPVYTSRATWRRLHIMRGGFYALEHSTTRLAGGRTIIEIFIQHLRMVYIIDNTLTEQYFPIFGQDSHLHTFTIIPTLQSRFDTVALSITSQTGH